jgi:hypothetical protein
LAELTKKQHKRLAAKIRRHQRALAVGRYWYDRAHNLLNELGKEMTHGQEIVFNEHGDKATFTDPFADSGKAFKPVFMDRYALKVKEAPRARA